MSFTYMPGFLSSSYSMNRVTEVKVVGQPQDPNIKSILDRTPQLGQQPATSSVSIVPSLDGPPIPVTGSLTVDLEGIATETTLQSVAKESTLDALSAKLPPSLGPKTSGLSLSVTPSSDGFPVVVSDVATNTSLNALSAKIPPSLGAKTSGSSLSVTPSSDGFPVVISDVATNTTLSALSAKLPPLLGSNISGSSLSVVPCVDGFVVDVPGVAADVTLQALSDKLPPSLGTKDSTLSLSVVPSSDGFPVSVPGVATEITLNSVSSKLPPSLGSNVSSSSLSVVPSSDGFPVVISDVATNTSLNALSAKLPPSLGPKVSGSSLSVVPSSDGFAVDVPGVSTDATLQSMSAKLPPSLGPKTSGSSLSVVASSDGLNVSVPGVSTETTLQAVAKESTLGAMSAKLPPSLGPKVASSSLSVVASSDGLSVSVPGVATETTLNNVLTAINNTSPSSAKTVTQSTSNTAGITSLSEGSTYTGTIEDVSRYSYMTIIVGAGGLKRIGILYVTFFRDDNSTPYTQQMRLMYGQYDKSIMVAVKGTKARVSFLAATVADNTSSIEGNSFTTFSLSTFLHTTSPQGCPLNMDRQKRSMKCYDIQASGYKVSGFGTSYTTATFPFPNSNVNARFTTNSASNGEASNFLRTVLIIGLGTSFNEVYCKVPVTSNGSTTLPIQMMRVNEIIPWSYGPQMSIAANSSNYVELEISTGTWQIVQNLSPINRFMETVGVYTIPLGSSARILSRTHSGQASNNLTEIVLHKRFIPYPSGALVNRIDRQGTVLHTDISAANMGTLPIVGEPIASEGESISVSYSFNTNSWMATNIELELF